MTLDNCGSRYSKVHIKDTILWLFNAVTDHQVEISLISLIERILGEQSNIADGTRVRY